MHPQATTQARLLDDSLHQRMLLSDLKHLEKTGDRQRARVEALTTMVREWRSSFDESVKEVSGWMQPVGFQKLIPVGAISGLRCTGNLQDA